MSLEERTDFGPRFSGSFPEKRLKEIYGEEKYNKNLDAARQAQLQKVSWSTKRCESILSVRELAVKLTCSSVLTKFEFRNPEHT